MAELTVSVAKAIAEGQGATAWEIYQLARAFLHEHGMESPPYVEPAALSHAAGQEVAYVPTGIWQYRIYDDEAQPPVWSNWHKVRNNLEQTRAAFAGITVQFRELFVASSETHGGG